MTVPANIPAPMMATAMAEHTFDTKARFIGSDIPVTSSYTCGANATLLVLSIVVNGVRPGGAPTYNGVALTQAGSQQIASETRCEIWYMLAPPTGSAYTISIPNGDEKNVRAVASSYISSSGASAFDVAGGTTGTSITASQAVTPTKSGAVIVDSCGCGHSSVPTSNSQTPLYSTDNGLYSDNAQHALQAAAGSITFSWTQPASDDWCIAVAAFTPA